MSIASTFPPTGSLAFREDSYIKNDVFKRLFKVKEASITKPKMLLFFVRHGERLDQVDNLSPSEEA